VSFEQEKQNYLRLKNPVRYGSERILVRAPTTMANSRVKSALVDVPKHFFKNGLALNKFRLCLSEWKYTEKKGGKKTRLVNA
jgi:hypothetical protein